MLHCTCMISKSCMFSKLCMISKSCTFPFVVTTKESVPNSPLAALSTFSTSTTSRSGITTVTRSRTCKLGNKTNNYIDGQNKEMPNKKKKFRIPWACCT